MEAGNVADLDLPLAPKGARNLVVVVLDSLRYDSWLAAEPRYARHARRGRAPLELRDLDRALALQPAHGAAAPHEPARGLRLRVLQAATSSGTSERLGVAGIEFSRLLPSIFLPTFLKHAARLPDPRAWSRCPVLNPHTVINRDFDSYELMPTHNDMAAMVDRLRFEEDRPVFYLLNVGETHYPYALPDEDPSAWPTISGVHGVFKHLDSGGEGTEPHGVLRRDQLKQLKHRQIQAVEHVDSVFTDALRPAARQHLGGRRPPTTASCSERTGTSVTARSMHEKVLEVPFVEGMAP